MQSLFNAITPMSTGGQPAQIVALKQMGISVGKATSVLLMKFIIYQISVFGIYIFAFVTCFQSILAKFDG
ncbi:MAG: flippase-like domain-containing protein, partial [Lactobacillus iners]|nr:flippase-like domain-containing protein [Lactobacillus iners]